MFDCKSCYWNLDFSFSCARKYLVMDGLYWQSEKSSVLTIEKLLDADAKEDAVHWMNFYKVKSFVFVS